MTFVFRLSLENVSERSVLLIVQPRGSRDMLIVKHMADFGCSNPMRSEIEYLFHYPPRVLIGNDFSLDFGLHVVLFCLSAVRAFR